MNLLILIILSALFQWIGSWWAMAIPAFGIGFYRYKSGKNAFSMGFVALACLWFAYAGYLDIRNQHLLSTKIAALLHLPNSIWLIGVTIIIGGCGGGLATWLGCEFRKLWDELSLLLQDKATIRPETSGRAEKSETMDEKNIEPSIEPNNNEDAL